MSLNEFVSWPKIPRWEGEAITVTEKIDGTSACVFFDADGSFHTQSRNRLITPDDDNAGFARWVAENHESLFADLGPGYSFGEWWGAGIQRRYDRQSKHFSLFNTHKFGEREDHFVTDRLHVVPVLFQGDFDQHVIRGTHGYLVAFGSVAAPGFMQPEGVVVRFSRSGATYKITDAVQGQKQRSPGE